MPGADVRVDAERECDDDRDLDDRVEEAGDEAGADTGEHELERDALRRRDRHAVVEEHVTNLDEFVRDRTPTWTELEQLVDRGRQLARAARRRRACCASARATARSPPTSRSPAGVFPPTRSSAGSNGSPSAAGTRSTTRRGRATRCASSRRTATGAASASVPGLLLIAIVCLALPTLLAGYWAWRDPGPASGLAPSAYQSVTAAAARRARPRRSPSTSNPTSPPEIFTNNIQVTFLAFAGGILLGLGTLYVLIQNGIMLGAVAGLAIGAGNGRPFFELVVAHGVLELSCIAVAGAAGLRIASAIVDPGTRPRMDALRTEARAPRSRSCSVPRCGSSSRAWSRASSRPRAKASRSC